MSRFAVMDNRPIFLSWRSKGQEEHGAVPKKVKFDREAFETLMALIGGAANNAFWKFFDGRPTPDEMTVKLKSGRALRFWKPPSYQTHLGMAIQEDALRSPILVQGDGLIIAWQCLRELVGFAEGLKEQIKKDCIKVEFDYGSLWIEMGEEVLSDTVPKLMGETT